jgi:uncharacterized membrane protein YbaN (DUF454 family)
LSDTVGVVLALLFQTVAGVLLAGFYFYFSFEKFLTWLKIGESVGSRRAKGVRTARGEVSR